MKTYKEFIQNLDENKLTTYMAKKAAKQMIGASSKLFSGKKSQGAKFLKKSVEGKNLRQKVANTLRGDKGIGTTHSQTKNLPAAKRMSEFELSKKVIFNGEEINILDKIIERLLNKYQVVRAC